jgi:CRP-like cAMP-binding protein
MRDENACDQRERRQAEHFEHQPPHNQGRHPLACAVIPRRLQRLVQFQIPDSKFQGRRDPWNLECGIWNLELASWRSGREVGIWPVMVDIANVKKVGLVSKLTPRELEALLKGAKQVDYKAGEEVLTQGAMNGSLYLIVSGVLHARRTGGRRSVLLARLEPGTFFGEMSLFDAAPTSASIEGVSDGSLIQITRACLDEFIDKHPKAGADFLQKLLKGVARRLRVADDRVTNALMFGGLGGSRSKEKP